MKQPLDRLPPEFQERYQLQAELGRGAGGVVVRALDRALNRPVAVKFLADTGQSTDFVRFQREARLLAQLTHPNVVTLYDVDVAGANAYLVMELVEGGSLRAHLRSRGRLELAAAVALIRGCLAGLNACHAAQVVHRDVKPENVLLTPAGVPKLADLGVGLYLPATTRLTATGGLVGTPRYMCPEQLNGETSTPAADVYALAAMFHEMLSGAYAFPATNFGELIRAITQEPTPRLEGPGVPPALADLIARALAKEPGQRPADAAAFTAQLDAALAPRPASAGRRRPVLPVTPRPAPASPPRVALAVGAAALVAVAALAMRAPERAPIAAMEAAPVGPVHDAGGWADATLRPLESALDAVVTQYDVRRARWTAVHRDQRYTLEDMSPVDHPVKLLRSELAADVEHLAHIDRQLARRTEDRRPTPAEQVLRARLLGAQFMTEAPRERLSQYVERGIPTSGKTFDGLGRLVIDEDTLNGPAVARYLAFCAAFPDALKAAVLAGAAAGSRPGHLIAELSLLMYWLNAQAHGARTMPEIVSAGARLRAGLDAFAAEPALTRAGRAACVVTDWRRTGIARREDRQRVTAALADFRALAAELPGAAVPLALATAEIERDLAEARKATP